jgi:hypothetical protein
MLVLTAATVVAGIIWVLVGKVTSMHAMYGHSLKSVMINIVAYFASKLLSLVQLQANRVC